MKTTDGSLKQTLKQFKDELCHQFCQKTNITVLTRRLVNYVDKTLLKLFYQYELHISNVFCLLALGSYGRRELQLHSDIDLLLLHINPATTEELQRAQAFIQACWDVGLAISHQITTVEACAELANHDLSVISSLLDMQLLCGNHTLMEELQYQIHPLHLWPSNDFFFAKLKEQEVRYKKYGETAYHLEPNVKQGSGGLRDLQILLSISKRHFGIKKLADGIHYGFITEKEYEQLISAEHFLWRVRFALHFFAGKQEERLTFDYQVKLASLFGFIDTPESLAIEQFMKTYFKVIKHNRELNEMLLQWFSEAITCHEKKQIISLNNHFQLINHFIEVKSLHVFSQHPHTLLELFVWIAKEPSIVGVRASTIRLIRQHLYLMGKTFRASSIATELFMTLFKEGINPYKALHHMNRYGVLGHYLDCFAAVTGQMQYDLFHIYTVDQHTLFVIRNLVRFLNPKYSQHFSLAASLMPNIEKPEILYLAALFHDIAKGRGGDHSELGAAEAELFALRHKLPTKDTKLLIWLVRYHLLMSQTAQRQDIYDPKIIHNFCHLLPSPEYLNYLYLLTVADICATNKTLWNSWKDSLLKELYHAANIAQQEQQMIVDETILIASRKEEALSLLRQEGICPEKVTLLWHNFKGKYFLHGSPKSIAAHSKAILSCQEYPLVLILPHHSQGGTEIFIYMPHRNERFTIATTVLNNHQITIQEATILTCENQFDMDTYIILDERHKALVDERRIANIQEALFKQLGKNSNLPTLSKHRLSRTQAHFNVKPQLSFDDDMQSSSTCLFLVASDRPGLLAKISRVFLTQHIHLHNAKIATAGERAEDMFYISNQVGLALNTDEKECLKANLMKELI